eukprot:TRINITY_DN1166_c0_g1_i1.p1 TRINITY_DN1166_c0_g1~~TRINITY_DN1166_c0_g1_i1.p1  ORF type:complete len:155 (-),score=24.60 TRINITY_DN1166_c0_g1_i1:122-586(-)
MPVQVVDSNGKSSVPSNSFSLNPQMAGNLLPQGHYPLRRPGSRLGLAVSTDTGRTSRTGRTGKQMRVNTNGDGPNLSRTPPKFSNTSNSSILELFTIHKKMKDTPEFIKAINAGSNPSPKSSYFFSFFLPCFHLYISCLTSRISAILSVYSLYG